MYGRTRGGFDGFQIQTSGLAPVLENHTQELLYFPCDLLADGFERFFPAGIECLRPGVPGRFFRSVPAIAD